MSIMRCCFCETNCDTDFDTGMTITIIQHVRRLGSDGGMVVWTDEYPHHFCGECKDPTEISQILTDLNIDHTIE